jgi:hypothetical protein
MHGQPHTHYMHASHNIVTHIARYKKIYLKISLSNLNISLLAHYSDCILKGNVFEEVTQCKLVEIAAYSLGA